MASKEEVKAQLDDPYITLETKKQLLSDYKYLGASDDEVADYERKLGVEPGSTQGRGLITGLVLPEVDAVQAQSEHDLGQSWANLNDSTPSPRSDDILDDGIVGLRIF